VVYESSPHRLILASTWDFDKVSKVSGVWVEPRHTSEGDLMVSCRIRVSNFTVCSTRDIV
jgi:hypothetical protein